MEIKTFLIWLTCPELFSIVSLFIPSARRWLLRMVEDSDGDPHHTDGFFIVVLWSASLCIRFAVLIAWWDILHDKGNLELVSIFLGFAAALLGVRFYKNKFTFKKPDE